MKTSVIEVRDLLSVLTVDEVEKRIEDVAGVESVTVNYDAKNATVRYDETLLEVADIKVLIHQRGQQSTGMSQAKDLGKEKSEHELAEKTEQNTETKLTTEVAPTTPAAVPTPTGTAGGRPPDKAGPNLRPTIPVATEPKPPASDSAATPAALQADEHEGHEEPGALDKLTAWVREAFAGADKNRAEPGAPAATLVTTDAKTSPETPATEPKTAPVAPADKHAGHKKPTT